MGRQELPWPGYLDRQIKFLNPHLLRYVGRLFSGRLSYVWEPASKIRIIAMVDYWTQAVLSPLHKFLFQILRGIPNDATFGQSEVLKEWIKGRDSFFCYDLTSATDLMPVGLQVDLLASLIGRRLALLWKALLVD